MGTYIVERYVQASGLQALIRSEREALEGVVEDGVRHLRSTYLRDDELCLSFIEGPSLDSVRRVNERAGLPFERITEAVDVTVEGLSPRAVAKRGESDDQIGAHG